MNGLYIAASGAASELQALDVIASNLANSSTPGYRRFLNVLHSVSGHGSPYQFAAADSSPPLDPAQGPIHATGNPLDVAITGPEFIAVQTANGTAYTRNGQLQRASDGTLLAAGQPVLNPQGQPITLPAGDITIGGDGSISVDSLPAGSIMLGDSSGVTMAPIGASLYQPQDANPLPAPAAPADLLKQGYLESSTGSAIGEMVAMAGVMRSYDGAMRAVHAIDQDRDRAIQAFTLSA